MRVQTVSRRRARAELVLLALYFVSAIILESVTETFFGRDIATIVLVSMLVLASVYSAVSLISEGKL